MSQFPSPKEVERIKKMYPKGTRIQIERMNDPYHPIERGTKGTVDHVDDAGTLHCTFDNGRTLGVVTDADIFHVIDRLNVPVAERYAYAFDVLMQIYLSCGYTERDAAQKIVRHNLWGLDLDKRAYQLAYFAVMMKARQYDRRFLTRGIKPNLSHFQDLPIVNYSLLDEPIKSFVEQFDNADTYGSLITVQANDEIDKALDEFQGTLDLTFGHMEYLMQLYKILSQRYDVVCTIIWIESQYVFYVLIDYLASDRLIVKNHEYI